MKYCIAADGGGTKLLSVLYDEEFHIIRTARTFGVNSNFKSREQVKTEVRQMVSELVPENISQIDMLCMSFVGDGEILVNAIKEKCALKDCHFYDEGEVALASAGVQYGIVAQAGTGSDAFLVQRDHRDVVGGWGMYLGDEGSGYDIGLQTLKAAIYSADGRGPKTVILDILMEDWEITDLWDVVRRMAATPDCRGLVASASYIASKAAAQKDAVAVGIYEKAARDLAHQVLTVIRRNGGTWEGPIVVSGGAWKGCPRMYECFCEEIWAVYPHARIRVPIYEPLVGSVIRGAFETGQAYDTIAPSLQDKFQQFML